MMQTFKKGMALLMGVILCVCLVPATLMTANAAEAENAADFNEREYVYPTCILGGTASAPCVDCGVKAVLENIYEKFGASSRVLLAVYLIKNDIIRL